MTVRLEWPDLPLVAGDPAPSWAEWRDGKWYGPRKDLCAIGVIDVFEYLPGPVAEIVVLAEQLGAVIVGDLPEHETVPGRVY